MSEDAEQSAEVDVPATDPAEAQPERTFSQADLDRIVKDRLARQRAQFADYDEIKGKLSEIEQASKTELEKALEKAAEFEKRMQDNEARAREALLRAAVVSEAAKKNVVDPDAALALLNKDALEFDEHGQPTNVPDLIDSLLIDKTYLAGKPRTTTGSADLGAREGNTPGQLTRDDLKSMSPAAIVQADQEGRLRDLKSGASQ